jgi:CheY-like chemotaxis protein
MPLYTSSGGDCACAEHAPLTDVTRWTIDNWRRVPAAALVANPRRECRHCASESGDAADTHAGERKPLVLNVDVRPASLHARERALRLHGFAVVNAATGAGAIETAGRVQPSLILLDAQLPDGDGRDICRRLKDDVEVAGIPVVIISATLRAHADNLDSLRWGGADGYVIEPIDADLLNSTIRRVLDQAGRRAALRQLLD